MPKQSVKQFRPHGIAVMVDEHGPIKSDPWHDVLAYIERLENALDHVAQRAYEAKNRTLRPVGDSSQRTYANAQREPWCFVRGLGATFLEAVEHDMYWANLTKRGSDHD